MIYSKFSVLALSLLVFFPMLSTGQRVQQDGVPLKNWATAQYWQPNQAEREAAAKAAPRIVFSANAVSTTALIFVAITPCRLVDTRGSSAGFNGIAPFSGPSIQPGGTITIPVQSATEAATNTLPAPCGVIPSIAQAYSLNLTVIPQSSGAVDYVSLWPSSYEKPYVSTLDDPQGAIVSNAAIVPAGNPTGGINVFSFGPAVTDVIIDMNGYFTAPTDLNGNTAVGAGTLQSNAGYDNTALGNQALFANNTGSYNTASGVSALGSNTTGSYNTAFGLSALGANFTGNNNIAIGNLAAFSVSSAGSNNIQIGSQGASSDSGVIRIGIEGTQNSAYIAGIDSASVPGGVPVYVTSTGQLGTSLSSRRFKEQITDMGDTSNKLLLLRPVNFFYKPQYDDGSHLLQYGLIAEEVAKVYPEMVAYDHEGQISTVRYQMLAPMLLNEMQKQNVRLLNQVQLQQQENRKLEDRLSAVEALLSGQTSTASRPASGR